MRRLLIAFVFFFSGPAHADVPDVSAIIETHVLPRYQTLVAETNDLAEIASQNCSSENQDLIVAFHNAFDAWVGVSHLRFGPSEHEDRAFALAFWPDPRGATPRALNTLIAEQDPAVSSPEGFGAISIAARGFYALEFLLFDPQFTDPEYSDYHCALIKAVTQDIAKNSAAIHAGWEGGYADLMSEPGNDTYRTSQEAAQQLFTALSTGLEFTSQARVGRPIGTFARPRPKRAEVWRSGRSLRHVILALTATRELALLMSDSSGSLAAAYEVAMQRAISLDDPVFAAVADPQGRLRVEVLQQNIDAIRSILAEEVGPSLGIAAGFNSLDGD